MTFWYNIQMNGFASIKAPCFLFLFSYTVTMIASRLLHSLHFVRLKSFHISLIWTIFCVAFAVKIFTSFQKLYTRLWIDESSVSDKFLLDKILIVMKLYFFLTLGFSIGLLPSFYIFITNSIIITTLLMTSTQCMILVNQNRALIGINSAWILWSNTLMPNHNLVWLSLNL